MCNLVQCLELEFRDFRTVDHVTVDLRDHGVCDDMVANPSFSDKTWSAGLTPDKDAYQRLRQSDNTIAVYAS